MEHHDDAARLCADWDQIRALWAQTERALDEEPGPLRQLRVHCLRERSQLLLRALAEDSAWGHAVQEAGIQQE
ncbi:hypothetical protein [Ramlibacter albus]|uniref:Uncharacterized protein n=1 Tax=Ramlibacter albus TaxID=2079448 RepID=A0A923MA45_9BURK|nr:hypothetical protein [Ramlibacter albus]MBC5767097.1 hypothetical protein [Ramlibacter albus]